MKNAVIYVHGKGGNAEEADHYKQFFDDSFEIIGFDYKSLNPWDAKIEFRNYFHSIISKYNKIYLIANSIRERNRNLFWRIFILGIFELC